MSLVVYDHKLKGHNSVRVAVDTGKLVVSVGGARECSAECSGPRGCLVRVGVVDGQRALHAFLFAWRRDTTIACPDWVVYVYEVTKALAQEEAEKAKAERAVKPKRAAKPKRARVRAAARPTERPQ